ncbi:MAG: hypothetical protein HOP31_06000 [Ignavibacteria bacterium]|nr:hypothetical protein [Ignavibacteria bacterium]
MKIVKYLKIMTLPSILLAVLITGFSLKKNEISSLEINTVAELKQVEGLSSFYCKPADDTRLWHVVNKYGMDSNGKYVMNNSTYTFTADSVTVVNEIASVPDWEPYISGLIFKKN